MSDLCHVCDRVVLDDDEGVLCASCKWLADDLADQGTAGECLLAEPAVPELSKEKK